MKISRELKVGILSMVTIAMLYFGFNFLKGSDLFSRTYTYYVVYDNVDGLTSSNPVLLNGLSVGRVQAIRILQDRNNQLLVALDIQKSIVLRQQSSAVLADGGLLGGKIIRLEISPTGAILEEGDTLVATKEAGISALLQEKALPVLTHADSLVRSLNAVTTGFKETGEILNQVLRNYDQTGLALRGTLEQNQKSLATLTANLSKLSTSLVETEKEIKPLLTKAGTFADSLNALRLGETVAGANQMVGQLQQLLQTVNTGQGTAGKLINDDQLYNNLNYSLISLNQLLANFREHPKRYVNVSVFGKKDKGPAESPIDTTLEFKK
ncbi:MlaD family protein [Arundinibacter roseus]|uniref:MCE family protein n=1 Tax=Arundinibacter roseus TaxID=2070510 RepID=A0A4R4KBR3_9BACT|nr:MlaD family protein [Arundinibacter roseus]TDB63629.1 MCE family protein [Arundinibacter roseus]